jgi:AcrR family transcriptional regulator
VRAWCSRGKRLRGRRGRSLAQHGLEGAKIRDIARDAEVSTALIHYHFATKTALLEASLAYAWDRAASMRVRTEFDGRNGTPAQRLADLVTYSLPSRPELREEWLLWMELWLQTAREPSNRRVMDGLYKRIRNDFTSLITEGNELGESTPRCPCSSRSSTDTAFRR